MNHVKVIFIVKAKRAKIAAEANDAKKAAKKVTFKATKPSKRKSKSIDLLDNSVWDFDD
jgi:hypothetical protein